MMAANADVQVNAADEMIQLGPLGVRFLLTGAQSNGSVAAFELTVPGSERLMAPAHSHDHYEETIYGVEGSMTWTVDGKAIELGPGQMLCIPRGAVHRFDNFGQAAAKSLCVITPAAIGPEYFRDVRTLLDAAAGGPVDRAQMMAVMLKHGLTPSVPKP